ncbi:MAG: phytoene/squalene synthase family protein [Bacteroidota bacterium]
MVGFLDIEEVQQNYRQCQAYTRRYARSFYFASHVLPREKRLAAYAVYAFCRYADNIVDATFKGEDRHRTLHRLEGLRDQLRYVYSFSPSMDSKLLAFRDVVVTYQIPQEYFLSLLHGVEMDLTVLRCRTTDELMHYCYHVASVVGLIMTHILGVSDKAAYRHAADLGTAMQLTNILRDVGEDARLGRCYLPSEELGHYRLDESDIVRGTVTPQFREFMIMQIQRARTYYASAEAGIPMIANDGSRFCVKLMSATYSNILKAIESNNYDVFTKRAYVSLPRKAGLAIASIFASSQRSTTKVDLHRPAESVPGSPCLFTHPDSGVPI